MGNLTRTILQGFLYFEVHGCQVQSMRVCHPRTVVARSFLDVAMKAPAVLDFECLAVQEVTVGSKLSTMVLDSC